MRALLAGLFIVLPILELIVIIKVGGVIGALPTIALLMLSAIFGAAVMRRQGRSAWMELQRAVNDFADPTTPMAHGALILMAGALLIVPGFLTDIAGILLLIRPVRTLIMGILGRRIRAAGETYAAQMRADQAHRAGRGQVIDAEFLEIDTDAPSLPKSPNPPRGPSGWTQH